MSVLFNKTGGLLRLTERDPDALFVSPDNVAVLTYVLVQNLQRDLVGMQTTY